MLRRQAFLPLRDVLATTMPWQLGAGRSNKNKRNEYTIQVLLFGGDLRCFGALLVLQ